jgi:hypothetical protein
LGKRIKEKQKKILDKRQDKSRNAKDNLGQENKRKKLIKDSGQENFLNAKKRSWSRKVRKETERSLAREVKKDNKKILDQRSRNIKVRNLGKKHNKDKENILGKNNQE